MSKSAASHQHSSISIKAEPFPPTHRRFHLRWHASDDKEQRSLAAYLGLTDEEYDVWLMDTDALPQILAARRTGRGIEGGRGGPCGGAAARGPSRGPVFRLCVAALAGVTVRPLMAGQPGSSGPGVSRTGHCAGKDRGLIHDVRHRRPLRADASTPRLGCRPAPRLSQTMACPRGWSLHSLMLPSSETREVACRPDMRCQDPMHQSCAGIGGGLMATRRLGVTKRDACEMASPAVHRLVRWALPFTSRNLRQRSSHRMHCRPISRRTRHTRDRDAPDLQCGGRDAVGV